MVYEKYNNNSVKVNIENIDDKRPYTSIGSKVFLSCKNVCEIKLPDTISEIGDWAFAHMKELKTIIVPSNDISIGRDAFLDCSSLEEIIIYPDESRNKGLSYLMASCITVLKSYDLLDFKKAAYDNCKWCEQYDCELIRYINQPDEKNFRFYIVGWFDDECEEEQLQKHIEKERRDKLSLSFLRLKYDTNIQDETKNNIVSYIKNRFDASENGCDTAWIIFKNELSDDLQNVKAAVDNNLLNDELILELIKSINKRNGNPEISAYLLSLSEEKESLDQMFKL